MKSSHLDSETRTSLGKRLKAATPNGINEMLSRKPLSLNFLIIPSRKLYGVTFFFPADLCAIPSSRKSSGKIYVVENDAM